MADGKTDRPAAILRVQTLVQHTAVPNDKLVALRQVDEFKHWERCGTIDLFQSGKTSIRQTAAHRSIADTTGHSTVRWLVEGPGPPLDMFKGTHPPWARSPPLTERSLRLGQLTLMWPTLPHS